MRFELSVCLRYLAPKRGRLFVSVSTLLSILGLAVGVMTYITVIAVMTGFRNQITNAYTGYFSDLVAYKEKEEGDRRIFDLLRERDVAVIERAAQAVEDIQAISPFIYGRVTLQVGSLSYFPDLRAVDPVREPKVSAILSGNKLLEGDFKFKRDGDYVAIVIGKPIADKLGLRLNDELLIASTGIGSVARQRTSLNAYVAGIFRYGNIEQDMSAYTSIETAQILQGLGGDVHRVSIKLTETERADEIKPRLAAKIEELRKRDLLPEYRATLRDGLEKLDASIAALEGAPASLEQKGSDAELDEDQAKRLEALVTLLGDLPDALAKTKPPIEKALGLGEALGFGEALGLDDAFGLDDTAPLEAAVAAIEDVREKLLAGLSLVIGLEATLEETHPLRAELTAVEDALADADGATGGVRWLCRDMLFEPFVVHTWSELNPDLFRLVKQEGIITGVFVLLIVVVAGFIIISALSMTVVQKKREIGIMRAMGARATSVATIFGLSGFVIGVLGTVFGTLLGLLLSYNFNAIRDRLMPQFFSPYDTIPISVQLPSLIFIWSFTILFSILASVVPAITAARLHPAEALRWE